MLRENEVLACTGLNTVRRKCRSHGSFRQSVTIGTQCGCGTRPRVIRLDAEYNQALLLSGHEARSLTLNQIREIVEGR